MLNEVHLLERQAERVLRQELDERLQARMRLVVEEGDWRGSIGALLGRHLGAPLGPVAPA